MRFWCLLFAGIILQHALEASKVRFDPRLKEPVLKVLPAEESLTLPSAEGSDYIDEESIKTPNPDEIEGKPGAPLAPSHDFSKLLRSIMFD